MTPPRAGAVGAAPSVAAPGRRRSGLAERVFPGDTRVWLAAGAVFAALLAGVIVALLVPREAFVGTNSVGTRAAVAEFGADADVCARRVRVPAGTGAVRVVVDTRQAPRPALRLRMRTQSGEVIRSGLPASRSAGLQQVNFPIAERRTASLAQVCVAADSGPVFVYGTPQKQSNDLPLLVGGKPVQALMALWFLSPGDTRRSLASHLGEIFERAALFRPRPFGAWMYWLLFPVALPGLAYAAFRLLATAESPRRRRIPLALAVGMVAWGAAATWAVLTPAFQSPDESEHFAYVQYLAETGRSVERTASKRWVTSFDEGIGLEGVRHASTIERPESRQPWFERDERYWRARHDEIKPRPVRDNGGGAHPATESHSPAYYAALAPAYLATRNNSVFTQLFLTRLVSALFGAVVAAMAFLVVLELLPRHRGVAVAAGLLVALQPMFGFISGAVNNDGAVNAACAVLVYLLIRALRRGLSVPLGIGIAVALALAPIAKGTGYALYPPALLGLAAVVWRHHRRADLVGLAALAGAFLLVQAGWSQLAQSFGQQTFTTPGGATPGTSFLAFHEPLGFLSWLWQVFVPVRLPFLTNMDILAWPAFDIYVERGWASFGWYAILFPKWVYVVIVLAIGAVGAMGLATLVRERDAARGRGFELAFLVAVAAGVLVAVEAAYFSLAIPRDGVAEQGRYAFTAITAFAAMCAGACFAFGRRRALPIAAGLVGAVAAFGIAARFLSLAAFYS